VVIDDMIDTRTICAAAASSRVRGLGDLAMATHAVLSDPVDG